MAKTPAMGKLPQSMLPARNADGSAAKRKPKRRGFVRKSRAKPRTGWTLRELASMIGLKVRTLRLYLRSGVLPKSRFRGAATRYERPQLVRLVAARRMMAGERLTLKELLPRLEALSADDLERVATVGLPPSALATALGVEHASPPPAPAAGSAAFAAGLPRWKRLELALGVELHFRDDAGAQVVELVGRIREFVGLL